MASSSRPKNLTSSGSGKRLTGTNNTEDDDGITPLPGISRTSTLPLPKNSGLRSRSVSPVKRNAGKGIYKHEEYNESNASLLSNASFLPDTPSPLLPPDLKKLRAFRKGNPNGELGDDSDDDDDDDDGFSELGGDASVVDKLARLVYRNSGILLMLAAQVFASTMSVITRLLETGFDTEFHALQILFTRQVISVVLCSAYMHYTQVPHFPLGPKGVRWLLVARGVGGFFGVFGLYYSLTYLDVSDATVITFLAPSVAGFACYIILKEPFTKTEMIAGLVSLLGVVLIARPTVLFSGGSSDPKDQGSTGSGGTEPSPTQGGIRLDIDEATPSQRFTAIMVALLGVLGAASAYTTIRWIGKRAHPLISVNYFSAWCVIVSFLGLLVLPGIGFKAPQTFLQWILLLGIGICGFCMQFLLTAAIQRERAGLVTHMVYAQMIFALIWDKVLWDRLPAWTSWLGSLLILGSGFWVAFQKNRKKKSLKVTKKEARSKRHVHSGDEERGLVAAKGSDDEDSEEGSELDEDEARVLDVGREIQMKNLAR
ncbi:hypothetical protein TWF102_008683 [Orbilia oligospora]|uniref:EamA domain-containing protein n=1 Tax=Orbilia oligospora TaxID=2813651 RepID=A0A7C8JBD9_ORBOL|nr:hypothetical protein TWF102_008683 [Orbilia oligospora]KAF3100593.1 hypothetical protein TWF706_006146 [Orbilia oligospora]KAF3101426.1 hypothetical protein TWF103_007993 [Orbilia oligospora]